MWQGHWNSNHMAVLKLSKLQLEKKNVYIMKVYKKLVK